MDYKMLFMIFSGAIFIIAFIPYIRSILKGETKPKKATWLIWAVLDSITLAGMIMKNSVNGQILGAILGVWVITFLAFRKGESGWDVVDKVCLVGALIGITFILFGNPVEAMIASLSGILIGSLPTFKSAWQKPENEDKLTWMLWLIGSVFALFAIPNWKIEHLLQPAIFFTIDGVVVFLLFVKPLFKK